LRNVRNAISRAGGAAAALVACALRNLRQCEIEKDIAGICAGDGSVSGAAAAISGAALRTMPTQIFFGAADAAGRSRE
jgi:hypothetical protein